MGASYLDEDRLRRSITAIATAAGRGAIGIVRVSGRDAIQIAARVFSRPGRLTAADSHTMTLGKIRHPDGSTIDEVIAAVMRAPNSYTGDDSVEFQCHGGHVPTNGVLQACLEAGALPALPGEFTFRGFINGRIDLTQAEAVADLINSSTASAARTALEHSDGVLRKELEHVRQGLVDLRARCEATIDFVDDDIPDAEHPKLVGAMESIGSQLDRLCDSYMAGRLLRDGARVVLIGQPNVGKSSLFNAILETERAIVTEIPGTTRDAVTEWVDIEGMPVILADTAGMRDSSDLIESEGVRRSEQMRDVADLILEVVDLTVPVGPVDSFAGASSERAPSGANSDRTLVGANSERTLVGAKSEQALVGAKSERTLTVLNKADLVAADRIPAEAMHNGSVCVVSATTGRGIKELCRRIADRLGQSWLSSREVTVTKSRHFDGLCACRESLQAARSALDADEPLEVVSLELRTACTAIDELVGRVFDEQVINRIFSEFCIGK